MRTTFTNLSSSALVINGSGVLDGMYVNSTSSGTIKFWNALTATGAVINNTITPDKGYHKLGGCNFDTGLYADTGATIDVTIYTRFAE